MILDQALFLAGSLTYTVGSSGPKLAPAIWPHNTVTLPTSQYINTAGAGDISNTSMFLNIYIDAFPFDRNAILVQLMQSSTNSGGTAIEPTFILSSDTAKSGTSGAYTWCFPFHTQNRKVSNYIGLHMDVGTKTTGTVAPTFSFTVSASNADFGIVAFMSRDAAPSLFMGMELIPSAFKTA